MNFKAFLAEEPTTNHPFDKAGFGPPPYRFMGMKKNWHTSGAIGDVGKPGGTCDYCGTGIAFEYYFKSTQGGREFKVGSDCMMKADKAYNGVMGGDVIDGTHTTSMAAIVKKEKKKVEQEKKSIDDQVRKQTWLTKTKADRDLLARTAEQHKNSLTRPSGFGDSLYDHYLKIAAGERYPFSDITKAQSALQAQIGHGDAANAIERALERSKPELMQSPHPKGFRGKTYYDYLRWMMDNGYSDFVKKTLSSSGYLKEETTTHRFDRKKDAEKFANEARAQGFKVFIGKRSISVPKEWQKPDIQYIVDVTK